MNKIYSTTILSLIYLISFSQGTFYVKGFKFDTCNLSGYLIISNLKDCVFYNEKKYTKIDNHYGYLFLPSKKCEKKKEIFNDEKQLYIERNRDSIFLITSGGMYYDFCNMVLKIDTFLYYSNLFEMYPNKETYSYIGKSSVYNVYYVEVNLIYSYLKYDDLKYILDLDQYNFKSKNIPVYIIKDFLKIEQIKKEEIKRVICPKF